MRNHRNEVIGVIQLINRKIRKEDRLTPEDALRKVIPYEREFEEMALSLASQAGVAVENTLLLAHVTQLARDIERLFNGFVLSSSAAIEARDNTTAGHSKRICDYAMAMARRMNELDDGPFSAVRFTETDLKEFEYACVLHDIGKIGVPEEILVKATRLNDAAVDVIRYRLAYYKEYLKQEALRKQMRFLLELSSDTSGARAADKSFIAEIDEALKKRLDDIDLDLDFVVRINRLGYLSDEDEARLRLIAAKELVDTDGLQKAFLTSFEFTNLSVKRGNLTEEEREKINAHVVHTYTILSQIPWNKELARVPQIAGAHHERNDGSGYPRGLTKEQLPLQARILAMVDVYEALTAQDRPYKKAKPKHVALQILREEASKNKLDPDIVDLFIRDKLYDVVNLEPGARPPAPSGPAEPGRVAT
jgi:HD-GYP domain-containing protein (c-di-GMP phosphodiesterase class II)